MRTLKSRQWRCSKLIFKFQNSVQISKLPVTRDVNMGKRKLEMDGIVMTKVILGSKCR